MAAPDRIEGAVRAGETATAQECAENLKGFAEATGRPWALATVAFGRALTADPSDAEAWFQEALSHHERAGRRSTPRAPGWRTASGCAAATVASTPASTCVTPSTRFRTSGPKPWSHVPTRSCAPRVRPRASETRPR